LIISGRIPASNWDSSCFEKSKCWGVGIRNNQNIFRKIITNNSENNYKLSYTPKPPNPPSSPGPFQDHPSSRRINPNIKPPSPEK
jgi:hypothetical protein